MAGDRDDDRLDHDRGTPAEADVAGTRDAADRDGLGVYAISVAAELVGTGQQNLRLYERKGLLTPKRTDGGTRRYSETDLATLRRIGALLDEGLNLAGVKLVLELEAANRGLTEDNRELTEDNRGLKEDNRGLKEDNRGLRKDLKRARGDA